jgi:hypothetical protein
MSRVTLSYDEVDEFVSNQQALGNNVRWDGYTMVFFKRTDHGFTNEKGAFQRVDSRSKKRGGFWGMELRVDPGTDGAWKVPGKYVKSPR